ncbi:unnamed protein product [Cercopithifilaria johnstoni]|uniref:Potassium channel domain-containing protein n=1 Tax=Cercopithifilaria johnstoni TaxID=2874296 RepID=A0A8J2MVI6_9BILA|nr:unnamed protein product [Cercopithifilaria johnstoni]
MTSSGRLMTIIYAIVGIPLMLITLRDLGNFLYKAIINSIRLMHFTSRRCKIFGSKTYKTTIQQNNRDLAELESGISIDNNNAEREIENSDNCEVNAKFHIGDEFNEDSIKGEDAKTIEDDDTILSNPNPPLRIPVLLAIGITFSWIFLCAGLFKIWERDWTYAESCYFMFIRHSFMILVIQSMI